MKCFYHAVAGITLSHLRQVHPGRPARPEEAFLGIWAARLRSLNRADCLEAHHSNLLARICSRDWVDSSNKAIPVEVCLEVLRRLHHSPSPVGCFREQQALGTIIPPRLVILVVDCLGAALEAVRLRHSPNLYLEALGARRQLVEDFCE